MGLDINENKLKKKTRQNGGQAKQIVKTSTIIKALARAEASLTFYSIKNLAGVVS